MSRVHHSVYTVMLFKYRIIVEMIMILGKTLANFVMYLE